MAFTLPQLRLIQTVCEHGSLGKAASVLGVTQPALSRNLKELERQLGLKLFERHPSGLKPTVYGEAVLPYAVNALEEASNALEEVRILAGESRDIVRVGAVASIAGSLLPRLVQVLTVEKPTIRFKIIEEINEVLIDLLRARELDIIICGPVASCPDIVKMFDTNLSDSCGILLSANHPQLKQDRLSMLSLLNEKWVMFPTSGLVRKLFNEMMCDNDLPLPNVVVETRSANVIRSLVAQHNFVTYAPEPIFVTPNNDSPIVAVRLPEFCSIRQFSVYRRRRSTMSIAMRHTISILRTIAVDPGRQSRGALQSIAAE